MTEIEVSALYWTNLLMGAAVAAAILTTVLTSIISLVRTRVQAPAVPQPRPVR